MIPNKLKAGDEVRVIAPSGAGIVLVYIVLLLISSICCKLAKI